MYAIKDKVGEGLQLKHASVLSCRSAPRQLKYSRYAHFEAVVNGDLGGIPTVQFIKAIAWKVAVSDMLLSQDNRLRGPHSH